MEDVEKLIKEGREWVTRNLPPKPYSMTNLVSRLLDALETATDYPEEGAQ